MLKLPHSRAPPLSTPVIPNTNDSFNEKEEQRKKEKEERRKWKKMTAFDEEVMSSTLR